MTTTIDSLSRIAASDGRRTARNGAADALAHAFSADPLFTHFFPDQDNRRALSVHTFRFIVTHGLANGEVTVADAAGEIAGAAVWVPGENADRGIIDQARHGALPMLWRQPPAAVTHTLSHIRTTTRTQTLFANKHPLIVSLSVE